MNDLKVAIVGGGIAGLTAAITLKSKGIAFHLYEQCDEFREVGAGVLLNETTLDILKILNVGNPFNQLANCIDKFKVSDLKLEKKCNMQVEKQMYSIHRADLIKVLCSTLNKNEYSLGCKIEEVKNGKDGVEIKINNNTFHYDVLIAANGINSNLRKVFLPDIETRNTQQVVYRGIAEIQGMDFYKKSAIELWGENKRFAVIHGNGNHYYWCTVLWQKDKIMSAEENLKSELSLSFKNFHTDVNKFINASEGKKIIQTNTHDIKPNNFDWFNQRIVFVGDAIHCCTPDLSQGACLSIESAYTIGCCISKYKNINQAFEIYQQIRLSKVNYVKYLSFKYGRLGHRRYNLMYELLFVVLKIMPDRLIKMAYNKLTDINPILALFNS